MGQFGLFFITTAASMLIASGLGWALTEFRRPVFNFKPFNCRPCLSFWLNVVLASVGYIFIAQTSTFYGVGIALIPSFVTFLHLKSKVKVYE